MLAIQLQDEQTTAFVQSLKRPIQSADFENVLKGLVSAACQDLGDVQSEKVFQNVLMYELRELGFKVEPEVEIPIKYRKWVVSSRRLDLLVTAEDGTKWILELKATVGYHDYFTEQLKFYLNHFGIAQGYLVWFPKVDHSKTFVLDNPQDEMKLAQFSETWVLGEHTINAVKTKKSRTRRKSAVKKSDEDQKSEVENKSPELETPAAETLSPTKRTPKKTTAKARGSKDQSPSPGGTVEETPVKKTTVRQPRSTTKKKTEIPPENNDEAKQLPEADDENTPSASKSPVVIFVTKQ
jgi:GxxExxY protein